MTTLPSYCEKFELRHSTPKPDQINQMLKVVKAQSLDELIDQAIPAKLRLQKELQLPKAKSEFEFLAFFEQVVSKNKVFKSYIGMGYYGTIMPTVILRNILENPAWYTPYTPYQAEIAQGRLEAMINFQTLITDLTGMEVANASLLDEATAAAEAMQLLHTHQRSKKKTATRFLVDCNTFPQTIGVLATRAAPLGIELLVDDIHERQCMRDDVFGVYIQNPNGNGALKDYSSLIQEAHQNDINVVMGVDLMSLLLLKSPGEMGADIAIGSSQRFGTPMGFGGPHAAFFATKEKFKRLIPGRIIGVSVDAQNNLCYRMTLQTREQHIRRERATSNICTAQALLAGIAGMYAAYHGPEGLKKIALRIHGLAQNLDLSLQSIDIKQVNTHYFDTLKIPFPDQKALRAETLKQEVNFRYINDKYVGISLDETTSLEDVKKIAAIFEKVTGKRGNVPKTGYPLSWPKACMRESPYLTHPTFHAYQSEHQMLRYIKKLENKDISMAHSMISLGSCTMKLNATTEMIPITWPALSNIHPFAPADQTNGYTTFMGELESHLLEITQFTGISLQPNSGAQGEYAGLMVIRAYHKNRNEGHRNIALIPASAHGTNPASAVMAGLKVIVVKADEEGKIDIGDLKEKAEQHSNNLSCLMVTYPSTHGVFEEGITEICDVIHQHGGMVYMDGANMNAQVGLTSPATIGADVCHINLHKTFCIPHGGGGPGMGPICTNDKLKPFLPTHPVVEVGGEKAINAVSAAPWGSASILAISYAYIAMMGGKGLTNTAKLAILNANYIKDRLAPHFKILYTGQHGRCAHEVIVDCRGFKKVGIEVDDIAKRLIDYGFHAPTVSFPVPGTMMVEPTESESPEELDRFCDALIAIRQEVREVEEGKVDRQNNILKNAPHTAAMLAVDNWDKPYSRNKAAYPLPYTTDNKFWPPIGRVNNAHGDRNFMCTCPPISEYTAQG